ncbi:MAG TPA: DUF692 family protein [Anaerolineaceae bacterium]|jgi:uncharacterized protein (UPF0276 family)|nr:DUF692 family protein [Anaerolineaceae bacterium]
MKFAVNYSHAAADLLDAGQIDFDLFKFPDWPDFVPQNGLARAPYVHYTLMTGNGTQAGVNWDMITALRARTASPLVNSHLMAPESLDPADPAQVEAAIQGMVQDLRELAARFGPGNVVLENMPFYIKLPHLRLAVDPVVISRVLAESGCGFLLDTAHARITAAALGLDVYEYIQALPVDRLGEVHVTGVGWHQGERLDHLEMQSEDWVVFEWVMAQIASGSWPQPKVVSFEYGGAGEVFRWRTQPRVLAEQTPRIYATVQAARRS